MKRVWFISFAIFVAGLAAHAEARVVRDCPTYDAPFSADLPFVDVLLSSDAKAVVDREQPGFFDKLPGMLTSTQAPTFAAILTLREVGQFAGMPPSALARIDANLRATPVAAQDRAARCARYDNASIKVPRSNGQPRLLLFEKINGFRDGPSVSAAQAAFLDIAKRKEWQIVVSDKGGAITRANLRKFDAIIWNNISGDVLTLAQRAALKAFVEGGGGFIAVHGSAGDPVYFWDWYVDTLIGARFWAHPASPQFQDARVVVEDSTHPIARALPKDWVMNDEWYSFKSNPRAVGARVVATLDESSYSAVGMNGQNLRMGDHPIAWTNCIGKGRTFYSAIGHRPEAYSNQHYVAMLEAAITWSFDKSGEACSSASANVSR